MFFESHLCETEDVVNEEQHILTLSITEMLSHCQACTQAMRVLEQVSCGFANSMSMRLVEQQQYS